MSIFQSSFFGEIKRKFLTEFSKKGRPRADGICRMDRISCRQQVVGKNFVKKSEAFYLGIQI
jgi:hypothetical protein